MSAAQATSSVPTVPPSLSGWLISLSIPSPVSTLEFHTGVPHWRARGHPQPHICSHPPPSGCGARLRRG